MIFFCINMACVALGAAIGWWLRGLYESELARERREVDRLVRRYGGRP